MFLFLDRVTRLRSSGLSRNLSVRRSCRNVDFVSNNNNNSTESGSDEAVQTSSNTDATAQAQHVLVSEFKKSQLPLSMEALNSLTLLCFPGKT